MNFTEKCKQIRRDILQASYEAGACHIGSALSCVEIMVKLFYETMKPWDVFIFSKASGVATYYAILADKGLFPKDKVAGYLKQYPEVSKEVPGVIWSGGSCGHGLSVAAGLAYADRRKNVYCLVSDGELQEGAVWEAAMFAAHHKLSNLIVVGDRNNLQACGNTEEIMGLEPLHEKWESFGWEWSINDGNNVKEMNRRLQNVEWLKERTHKPQVIIANTIKGKGVDFMEGDYRWHYKNLTKELLDKALCQI